MKRVLIIVAVLLAVAGGVLVATVARPTGPIRVTAHFDEASGLYPGNAVEVLGIPVGTVAEVTPRSTYVEVVLELDGDVQVPADAMAVTVSTSILTDRRVELSPPYESGPVLQNHDLIPLSRTQTPVGFDRVLAMIDRLAADLSGDGAGGGPLADLVNAGAAAVDGNGQHIRTALDELSTALRMTTDGAKTKDELTRIVTGLNSLTTAMAANDGAIRQFGSFIRATSDVLAAERFGTGTTGAKINAVLTQAAEVVEESREDIQRAVGNGDVILDAVTDNQRELAEAFDVLPLLLENAYNAIDPNARTLRVHALVDKVMLDSQLPKEVCNMMGLRQLGCSTGTLMDYGPDFGLTYMLDSMARMGQR